MPPINFDWLSIIDKRLSGYHRMARRLRKDILQDESILREEEAEARRLFEEEDRRERVRQKLAALDEIAGLLEELSPKQLQGFEDAVQRRPLFS